MGTIVPYEAAPHSWTRVHISATWEPSRVIYWCNENLTGHFAWTSIRTYRFELDDDAVLFALKWGC